MQSIDIQDFSFTEEQRMLRKQIRLFAKKELAPNVHKRIKEGNLPDEIVNKMVDAGLVGLGLPTEYGGQNCDAVSIGIAVEEIAMVDPMAAGIIGNNAQIIAAFGSEEMKQEWLPDIIKGRTRVCFGLTEPECGSDAAAIQMKAVRNGSFFIMNGEKNFVSGGDVADAMLTFVKTDPSVGAKGISCFLVPINLPGISVTKYGYDPAIWRAWARTSVTFNDVKCPDRYIIGEEGGGFYAVAQFFDYMRVRLAIWALAMARSSLQEALEYANQRNAFGKPIFKFQGVSFKIIEHYTRIEAARLLCFRALSYRDRDIPHSKEAAMAKFWAPKVAVEAISDCIPIFGHFGYSEELPIIHRLLSAIGLEIGDGTAEIQKVIISRELIGKEFLPY